MVGPYIVYVSNMFQDDSSHPRKNTILVIDVEGCELQVYEHAL